MYLYTINPVTEKHLHEVMGEMKKLGAPTIRVVDVGDALMAIEGSHRIEAARRLSLKPELVILDQDDLVESDSLDIYELQPGEQYTAGEIVGELYGPHVGIYKIDDDGYLHLEREARNGLLLQAQLDL